MDGKYVIRIVSDGGHTLTASLNHDDAWLVKYMAEELRSGAATVIIEKHTPVVEKEVL